jgi:crotonobetainyl-CoA:carnitine CoA-transferase CaiB-like acyl-CoA transferase
MSYAAPFAGLKVIDLSQGVAGPYCGMLLAQHGANVIKVEPTGEGDWARTIGERYGGHTAYSIPTNLGKRSIALDLKSDEGKQVLWRLTDGADVLIEGFRPGVLERLGFGYDAVSRREPRILYLSVSGFGQTGSFSGRAAMDPVLQAFTGLMMDNKGEDGIPHRVPFVIIDMSTALYAFQALSAALYARRYEPRGRRIEVSLLEAASAIQAIRMMMVYLEGENVKRAMPERRVQDRGRLAAVAGDTRRQLGALLRSDWPAGARDGSTLRRRRRPHAEPGEADGYRAASHRRKTHRLLGRAPARGRHHARAAQRLPRVPGAPAGGSDWPHQLA